MVVLQSLAEGPRHGYAIGKWMRDNSGGVLSVGEGALYPALHRLQTKGFVEPEWQKTDTGRRAKFYSLTSRGTERLEAESRRWKDYSGAVSALMGETG